MFRNKDMNELFLYARACDGDDAGAVAIAGLMATRASEYFIIQTSWTEQQLYVSLGRVTDYAVSFTVESE